MTLHTERRAETLNFIQSMLLQLNQMAQAERCDMLAYLIEMSYIECGDLVRGVRPVSMKSSLVEEYKRHSAA